MTALICTILQFRAVFLHEKDLDSVAKSIDKWLYHAVKLLFKGAGFSVFKIRFFLNWSTTFLIF